MLKGSSILYLYVGCSCLTVAKSDASIRTMLKVSRAFTLGCSYKLLNHVVFFVVKIHHR